MRNAGSADAFKTNMTLLPVAGRIARTMGQRAGRARRLTFLLLSTLLQQLRH
jgi:hypothetical protein